MGITVTPGMEVIFRSPAGTDNESIEEYAGKRRMWIKKQLSFFEQFQPGATPRKYVGGETHLYLGRELRLRLVSSEEWKINPSRYYLNIYTPDKSDKESIRRRLEKWYRDQAKEILVKRHNELEKEFGKRLGTWMEEPVIRKMRSKWGLFDPLSGSYTLNSDLVKAPLFCIDYVILHENCHLKYHNHDSRFYALLSKLMPGWEKWKMEMERKLA